MSYCDGRINGLNKHVNTNKHFAQKQGLVFNKTTNQTEVFDEPYLQPQIVSLPTACTSRPSGCTLPQTRSKGNSVACRKTAALQWAQSQNQTGGVQGFIEFYNMKFIRFS